MSRRCDLADGSDTGSGTPKNKLRRSRMPTSPFSTHIRKQLWNTLCWWDSSQVTFLGNKPDDVGTYTPPNHCSYTTTIFNLSVTSIGRQYDRLALLFLGDTEVWRTSTAMPTESGIYWSYQKDMTAYNSLLRTEQKIIFSLDNVYSDLYTGAFNVTVEVLYYNDQYSNFTPADQIFPISALASAQNRSSVLSLPDDNSTVSIQFPRNVKASIVSFLASGNGAEEFWYTNVPSEYVNTFPENPGWLHGYSPFREIQLLIDGSLAGVSWPFPLLFTGGVDPGLWKPTAGIGAYDLPTFDIDVAPWLPLLCDGKPHTFELKVVAFDSKAIDNIGTDGENWYVSGAVFIWLDEASNQTTGTVSNKLLQLNIANICRELKAARQARHLNFFQRWPLPIHQPIRLYTSSYSRIEIFRYLQQ